MWWRFAWSQGLGSLYENNRQVKWRPSSLRLDRNIPSFVGLRSRSKPTGEFANKEVLVRAAGRWSGSRSRKSRRHASWRRWGAKKTPRKKRKSEAERESWTLVRRRPTLHSMGVIAVKDSSLIFLSGVTSHGWRDNGVRHGNILSSSRIARRGRHPASFCPWAENFSAPCLHFNRYLGASFFQIEEQIRFSKLEFSLSLGDYITSVEKGSPESTWGRPQVADPHVTIVMALGEVSEASRSLPSCRF